MEEDNLTSQFGKDSSKLCVKVLRERANISLIFVPGIFPPKILGTGM